ncbi:MAG: HSP20 family protein [Brevundimonas sp.]|jgi:HSP20 family protein
MASQAKSKLNIPDLQRSAIGTFAPIQREFNRLFDELGNGWSHLTQFELTPRTDMTETKEAVTLTMELPGMTRDDLTIEVEDHVLTVSGEKRSETETEKDNYRISERSYGAVCRSVTLPTSVKEDKIKATMADGVLTLVAPKDGSATTRTIPIQGGK